VVRPLLRYYVRLDIIPAPVYFLKQGKVDVFAFQSATMIRATDINMFGCNVRE
jgi:hypothetical protein